MLCENRFHVHDIHANGVFFSRICVGSVQSYNYTHINVNKKKNMILICICYYIKVNICRCIHCSQESRNKWVYRSNIIISLNTSDFLFLNGKVFLIELAYMKFNTVQWRWLNQMEKSNKFNTAVSGFYLTSSSKQ